MAYILAQVKKEQNEGSGKMCVLQIFKSFLSGNIVYKEESTFHCFGKTEKVDCSLALGEGNETILVTMLEVKFHSIAFYGRSSKGRISQLGMVPC